MIRLLLPLLALLLPAMATAQTVPVRSGAHAEFTRLVLDMPRRVTWRVQTRETGASVIFETSDDAPDLDFELDSVFDRIGRERVRAVAAGPGRLEIDFACACDLRAFWHGARMLVLDIAEVPQPPPETARSSSRPGPGLDPDGLRQRSTASTSLADRLDDMTGPTAPAPDTPQSLQAPGSDFSAMRDALIEQLGLAASRGLLEPARRGPHKAARDKPGTRAKGAKVEAARPVLDTASRATANMRVRNSIDPGLSESSQPPAARGQEQTCPAKPWMEVAAWGGADAFHAERGRLTRNLLGEFDRTKETVALDLARFYLHHGFGAEARMALDLRGISDLQSEVLREMAVIVDREEFNAPPGLAGALDCEASATLWALLAVPDVPEDLTFDHKALLRAFVLLPDGLRRTLGRALARRLLKAGHHETSRSILRLIDRETGSTQPEAALVRAELATARQEPDAARTALRVAVKSNSSPSAEALLALIEDYQDREEPVPLDKAELAGALSHEHRGTGLGDRLARAYITALAGAGAYDRAVSEFERLYPDLTARQADMAIAEMLIAAMTAAADDVTFLRHTLSGRLGAPGDFGPRVARGLSRRLLETGFPSRAAAFLAAGFAGHDAPASRLLRAEIALAQAQPRAAEAELAGLGGADADRLRAQARSLAGDHAAAAQLYAGAGQTEAAARAAFLAADPGPLSDAPDPVLRDVGHLLQRREDDAPASEAAPLAQQRRLLGSVAEAREVLNRLLAATPGPDQPVD